jgi:diguanylate cyclase (GGDEF)-like protein/PAS domain S-box-containing protein
MTTSIGKGDGTQPFGRVKKILLVDDDPSILESLTSLLELQSEYLVRTANNAGKAITAFSEWVPNIALVDVKLGQDSGLELIRELKRIRSDVVCITMTAYRNAEQTPEAVRSGADDFLYKPMDPSSLLKTVRRHLNHQQLVHERLEAERRFRGVFSETFQLLFLLDGQGRLTEANETALAFAGIEEDEVVGVAFEETPWWSSTMQRERLHRALGSAKLGEFVRYETEMCDAEGVLTPMDFSLKPILNESKEVTLIIAESRDLTEHKLAEQAVRESEEQFRLLLESTTSGIYGTDRNGICTFANSRFLQLLGYVHVNEVLGKNTHELFHHSHNNGEIYPIEDCSIYGAMNTGKGIQRSDEVFWRRDGSCFPVEFQAAPIRRDGVVVGAVITFTDITERNEADKKLLLANKVTESATEGILVTDAQGNIVDANPAFTRLTGFGLDEVLGIKPYTLMSDKNDKNLEREMRRSLVKSGAWLGEVLHRRKNGEDFPVRASISAAKEPSGAVSHYVGLYTDIADIKHAEARLERLAHYDSLTDLPNRMLFNQRLEMALSSARRHERHIAVLFIDLDRFKQVNDTLGHKYGDQVLIEVSRRLLEIVRKEDTVARLSGDEFTIILSELTEPGLADYVAKRVVETLSQPFILSADPIYIGASVGVALYPGDGLDAESLFRTADIAMYSAKNQGNSNYQFFDARMDARSKEKLMLELGLRHALEMQALYLVYQPKYELATSRIVGIEALLRWHSPEFGMVSPDSFIPIAEDTGLIIPIGEFVIKEACRQAKLWQDSLPDVPVAVNLSMRQFRDENLLPFIESTLQEMALSPDLLELELTESLIMDDLERNTRVLSRLKKMGLKISIDDFGTGYSSLSYIKRLPIDTVKIDKSFVLDLTRDMGDKAIVSTIITMAKNMNLHVLAEGVETTEQLNYLRQEGCHHAQGFLLGQPLSADQLNASLANQPTVVANDASH